MKTRILLIILFTLTAINTFAAELNFQSVASLNASVNELNILYKKQASSSSSQSEDRKKALKENLINRSQSLIANIQSDISILSQKSSLSTGEQQLLEASTKALQRVGEITNSISLKFGIPLDAKGNFAKGSVDVHFADLATLKLESPKHLRYRISQLGKAGLHMSTQYLYFQAALGILATAQLGWIYEKNPVAFQLLGEAATDPLAILGFGAFMVAQHSTAKMLNGVRMGIIPKTSIPYISMSAGMIASAYLSELLNDEDLKSCALSHAKALVGQGMSDDEACGKAWSNQALSGRIIQFAPMITSLYITTKILEKGMKSVGGAYANLKTLKAGLAASAEEGTATRIGLSGLKVLSGLKKAKDIASVVGGPYIAIANFVLFLGIDSFISPIVTREFNRFNLLDVDLKSVVDRYWSRREVLWLSGYKNSEGKFIPSDIHSWDIQDSFDVKATNFSSAHTFFLNVVTDGVKNGWAKKPQWWDCEQKKESIFGSNLGKATLMAMPGGLLYGYQLAKFLDSRLSRMKSSEQMDCEVRSQPLRVIDRLGEQSKRWRDFLIRDYLDSMDLWQRLVLNFSQQMAIANASLQYFSESRAAGKPYSFSELLMSLSIKDINVQPQDRESADELGVPSTYKNQIVRDAIDYTLLGFACGAENREVFNQGNWLEKAKMTLDSWTNKETGLVSQYGSEFKFTPPKVVNNVTKICELKFRQQQVMKFEKARSIGDPPAAGRDMINDGYWIDDSGREFKVLGDLIMANLRPNLFDSKAKFQPWTIFWEDQVMKSIRSKWTYFDGFYKTLIATKLTPNIFNRKVERGWAGMPVAANQLTGNPWVQKDRFGFFAQVGRTDRYPFQVVNSNSFTFMVSQGLVPSMEIEVRNYLLGLLTIVRTSTVPVEERKKIEASFVRKSNIFIASIRRNQAGSSEALEEDLSGKLVPVAQELDRTGLLLGKACMTNPSEIDNTFPNIYQAQVVSQLCAGIWKVFNERNYLLAGVNSSTTQFSKWLEGEEKPSTPTKGAPTGNVFRNSVNHQ